MPHIPGHVLSLTLCGGHMMPFTSLLTTLSLSASPCLLNRKIFLTLALAFPLRGVKMSESPNSTTQRCYLSFYYRRTSYRAISDTILINMDGNMLPSKLKTSRSGNHGERQYTLPSGKYYMYDIQRSNSGNTYITLKIINIDNKCNISTVKEWTLHSGKIIVTPIQNLPSEIREILVKLQNELPLFDYIYW